MAGDPRYKYGAAGGSPFDASTCGTLANGIPDPYTGAFDGIGAFVAPSQLQLHLQVSYDVSKTFTIVANVTNIVNACFGGSNRGWVNGSVNGDPVCGYGVARRRHRRRHREHLQSEERRSSRTSTRPTRRLFPFQPMGFFVNAKLKI